jgi:hypothetical protein
VCVIKMNYEKFKDCKKILNNFFFLSFCVENFETLLKYKNEILDIAKYACYCCQILCFGYQIHYAFELYGKYMKLYYP